MIEQNKKEEVEIVVNCENGDMGYLGFAGWYLGR